MAIPLVCVFKCLVRPCVVFLPPGWIGCDGRRLGHKPPALPFICQTLSPTPWRAEHATTGGGTRAKSIEAHRSEFTWKARGADDSPAAAAAVIPRQSGGNRRFFLSPP